MDQLVSDIADSDHINIFLLTNISITKITIRLLYIAPNLACGVDVTMKFLAYTGGVYSENKLDIGINHEISVTGWGYDEESQKEYWIGRNSWGTYWGEYGFFRIEMHKNNLGIETSCFWATPKI